MPSRKTKRSRRISSASSRISSAKPNRLHIIIEHTFSVPSKPAVEVAKRKIKSDNPTMVFSGAKKSRNGYIFNGKLKYVKNINATVSAVKSHLQARIPNAKVTVKKA